MTSEKRAVEPYIVPLDERERSSYSNLRIHDDKPDPRANAQALADVTA
jgi:hypothetical protein